jgi:predicted O-methyltransferase YrrM
MSEEDAVGIINDGSIDVFFYDGHHGAANTDEAIRRYLPKLKSPAVLVVDDYDWGPPCLGVDRVIQALPELGWREVRHWELTAHVPPVDPHNGMYVGVLERT